MDFPVETVIPQKTLFRPGALTALIPECLEFGPRGILVHGPSLEKNGQKDLLSKTVPSDASVRYFRRKSGEPELSEIGDLIRAGREFKADWIAGIGGGSVLDLAKAAAGLFNAKEKPVYYQEGGELKEPGIPFIAVPTTAGSGSEATVNAVIINPEKKAKLSIRDKTFMARKVILDPDLLRKAPPAVLRFSAMDALVQAYESFISKNATWFSETFALKAVELLAHHLPPGLESRAEEHLSSLLLGSYFSGIAFNASRLGVIHGIAHPLGALYHEPHGLICSVCLPASIKINRRVMGRKYDVMTYVVKKDFLEKTEELLSLLKIESPFRGKPLIEKEKIIAETLRSGSTAANPKPITREDVEFILEEIFK
ncbi:MAG TPA: iron-containing alcohol dehydrogenase [Candidatus Omnitrophota bacterium]|nr:iron-containing alcohol dehydrogenase [Candidatus Omnitrophota bacterium]